MPHGGGKGIGLAYPAFAVRYIGSILVIQHNVRVHPVDHIEILGTYPNLGGKGSARPGFGVHPVVPGNLKIFFRLVVELELLSKYGMRVVYIEIAGILITFRILGGSEYAPATRGKDVHEDGAVHAGIKHQEIAAFLQAQSAVVLHAVGRQYKAGFLCLIGGKDAKRQEQGRGYLLYLNIGRSRYGHPVGYLLDPVGPDPEMRVVRYIAGGINILPAEYAAVIISFDLPALDEPFPVMHPCVPDNGPLAEEIIAQRIILELFLSLLKLLYGYPFACGIESRVRGYLLAGIIKARMAGLEGKILEFYLGISMEVDLFFPGLYDRGIPGMGLHLAG